MAVAIVASYNSEVGELTELRLAEKFMRESALLRLDVLVDIKRAVDELHEKTRHEWMAEVAKLQ